MADALSLLDQLEAQERKKNPQSRSRSRAPKSSKSRASSVQSRRSVVLPPSRPTTAQGSNRTPPPYTTTPRPAPSTTVTPRASSEYQRSEYPRSERTRSQGGDSRRVSFVGEQRPIFKKPIIIPTRNDQLSSGFPHNPKLKKWIQEREWNKFSAEVVDACDAPMLPDFLACLWMPMYGGKMSVKVKKDLAYATDLSSVMKKYNREFKQRGFQVSLEIPDNGFVPELEITADMTEEQRKLAKKKAKQEKKDAKRFRILVNHSTSAPKSIYNKAGQADTVSREQLVRSPMPAEEPDVEVEDPLPRDFGEKDHSTDAIDYAPGSQTVSARSSKRNSGASEKSANSGIAPDVVVVDGGDGTDKKTIVTAQNENPAQVQ